MEEPAGDIAVRLNPLVEEEHVVRAQHVDSFVNMATQRDIASLRREVSVGRDVNGRHVRCVHAHVHVQCCARRADAAVCRLRVQSLLQRAALAECVITGFLEGVALLLESRANPDITDVCMACMAIARQRANAFVAGGRSDAAALCRV